MRITTSHAAHSPFASDGVAPTENPPGVTQAGVPVKTRVVQNRVLNPIRATDCSALLDAPFASITPLICALLPRLAR